MGVPNTHEGTNIPLLLGDIIEANLYSGWIIPSWIAP